MCGLIQTNNLQALEAVLEGDEIDIDWLVNEMCEKIDLFNSLKGIQPAEDNLALATEIYRLMDAYSKLTKGVSDVRHND